MAAKKPARKAAAPAANRSSSTFFTDAERGAMRDRAKEMKAEARSGVDKGNDEDAVLEKIAAMSPRDRAMAERVHTIVTASVPGLSPKLWYGMPAYAKNGGAVVCFFQPGEKFKTRYATLGFSDKAALDDGRMWPNSYALMELTPAEEARIVALVKQAAG